MKLNPDGALKRFSKARQGRQPWEDMWEEIYEYVLPQREGFFSVVAGEERSQLIYDETALVALNEFVGKMEQGITPSFQQWYRFEPGFEVPEDQKREFQVQLDEVGSYVWQTITTSNFATETQELLQDMAVGWSTQTVDDGSDGRLIQYKTIPQAHCFWDIGPNKMPDGMFRVRHKVKLTDIEKIWPTATLSDQLRADMLSDPEAETSLVECSYRDWDDGGQLYIYQILATRDKSFVVDDEHRGRGARPFITPRWSVAAGETYGRGPLVVALPAIRTVNLVQELTLQNAQMAISGIWQLDDLGTINADNIEIVPGAVYPRDPDSRGLEPTAPGGDFNVTNLIIANMQENIRRALFAENLGSLERTPRSATEVFERTKNLAEQVGSSYGRLINEWITPMLERVIYLLERQGRIEMPRLDGREARVVSTSALARGQRFEQVERVRGFVADVAGLAGPQVAMMKIDQNELVDTLQENWEVSAKLVRSEGEARDLIQQVTEAVGETQGGEGAGELIEGQATPA